MGFHDDENSHCDLQKTTYEQTYACLQVNFRVADGPCNNIFLPTLNEHKGQWYTQNHIWKICLLRLMQNFLLLFCYKTLHKHLQNDVLNEQTKPFLLQSSGLWHRVVLYVISDVSNEPAAWYVSRPAHRLTLVFRVSIHLPQENNGRVRVRPECSGAWATLW
jgi:hypothetical protein